MEDRQIVELYWQKNADAISETSSKYGAYCFTIADHILNNAEDSEECVNDTWLHAWNASHKYPSFANLTLSFFRVRLRITATWSSVRPYCPAIGGIAWKIAKL